MLLAEKIVRISLHRPKAVTAAMLIATLIAGTFLAKVQLDANLESMLSKHDQGSIFHDQSKKEISLHDAIVVGVVNDRHPDGAFNPDTLKKVHALSKFAATLFDSEGPERQAISPDFVVPDKVTQVVLSQVRFERLMERPPSTREEALKIRDAALADPLLKGVMASKDGKSLAIHLPITKKKFAYAASERLREQIKTLGTEGGDEFHIAGLSAAEDAFGKELLVQAAIFAPLTMLAIFLLMHALFRNLLLMVAPMLLAVCAAVLSMGLLISTGHALHVTSLLIPVFVMSIAVTDSIHILSEFFNAHQQSKNKETTIMHVMMELFQPMFQASLISAASFASLAAAPIQPIQSFGIFVGIGIMLAWLLTVTFLPAYVMLIPESQLTEFGRTPAGQVSLILNRHLRWMSRTSLNRPWLTIAGNFGIMTVGAIGVFMLQPNYNPIKWFNKNHEIRVADRVLNSRFDGIYEVCLILTGKTKELTTVQTTELLKTTLMPLSSISSALVKEMLDDINRESAYVHVGEELMDSLAQTWNKKLDNAPVDDNDAYEFWTAAIEKLEIVRNQKEVFRRPEVLRYLANLQAHLNEQGNVGKSNSISDVVKKMHQEQQLGNPARFSIPDKVNGVAETLVAFQNSHKPNDLWHFVSPNYAKATIWLLLRSGDNKDMERVIKDVEQYFSQNPPPAELNQEWAGQPYVNLLLQQKMTKGLLKSFLFCLFMAFVMTAAMFRSVVWGLLTMTPPCFAFLLVYGFIGFVGKDYDMPIAVLALLPLGLAVDFAFHFLHFAKTAMAKTGDWAVVVRNIFDEPVQTIVRIIIIAMGVAPLLLASLVPFQAVGLVLALIALCSGLATIWMLPALLTVMQGWIFRRELKA